MKRMNEERGAVAIMAAVLAVVIIGVAAFAVDAGNAFARQRVIQTQADLAALAGAALLDGTSASEAPAIAEAQAYLVDNDVLGGAPVADAVITVIDNYTKIRVTAPPATVDYGLAGVFGQSEQDVAATALAGIFSPAKLAPFFLAEACLQPGGSRLELKVDPGNVEPTPIVPEFFTYPDPASAGWPEPQSVTPFEVYATEDPAAAAAGVDPLDQTITIAGENFDTVEAVGFAWSTVGSENEAVVDDGVDDAEFTLTLGSGPKDDEIEIVVPESVVDVPTAAFPQERIVFVQIRRSGSTQWSVPTADASFNVPLPGADLPDGCGEKNTGDFGLVDSPREGSKNKEASQLNIAQGVDHALVPYPGGSSALLAQFIPPGSSDEGKWNDVCVKYTASPPFILDEPSPPGDPNCLEIYTGNKTPVLDAGLVEGVSGVPGRLDADALCSRTRTVEVGKFNGSINDDYLSCFLKDPNMTINQALQPSAEDVISEDIVDSPRFLLIPVLHADAPPANGNYPIVDYRGGMITAEDATSSFNNKKIFPDNGVILKNKSVGAMDVTYFDLDALPEFVNSTGAVMDYIGTGPKIVKLLE